MDLQLAGGHRFDGWRCDQPLRVGIVRGSAHCSACSLCAERLASFGGFQGGTFVGMPFCTSKVWCGPQGALACVAEWVTALIRPAGGLQGARVRPRSHCQHVHGTSCPGGPRRRLVPSGHQGSARWPPCSAKRRRQVHSPRSASARTAVTLLSVCVCVCVCSHVSFNCVCVGSESDVRFAFCACAISYFLDDWSGFDVEKTVAWIHRCQVRCGACARPNARIERSPHHPLAPGVRATSLPLAWFPAKRGMVVPRTAHWQR